MIVACCSLFIRCGIMRSMKRRYDYGLGQSWSTCRRSARDRGLEFNITLEQYIELVSQRCAYGKGKWPGVNIGLDRMDNTLGYNVENCAPCCARHNQIKSDVFSYVEMRGIARKYPGAKECGNTRAGRTKTHTLGKTCAKGHALTEDNIYRCLTGRIICATCSCERSKAWSKAKHRAQKQNAVISTSDNGEQSIIAPVTGELERN